MDQFLVYCNTFLCKTPRSLMVPKKHNCNEVEILKSVRHPKLIQRPYGINAPLYTYGQSTIIVCWLVRLHSHHSIPTQRENCLYSAQIRIIPQQSQRKKKHLLFLFYFSFPLTGQPHMHHYCRCMNVALGYDKHYPEMFVL